MTGGIPGPTANIQRNRDAAATVIPTYLCPSDVPLEKEGIIAQGTSDGNGKFSLQTLDPNDGAKPGKYKVAFKFVSDIVPDMPGFSGGFQPEKSPIPLKYEDENKSGITATVETDASKNEFKFELK